jgi:TRAP transporter TAXI family solute receptor
MTSRWRRKPAFSGEYLLLVLLPAILVVAAAVLFLYFLFRPGPPRTVVMTAGSEGGAYLAYAERYRALLARQGIRLKVLPSEGSLENLRRLKDPDSHVDIGFVQGGAATGTDVSGLVSLGALFYEPLWVFARGTAKGDTARSFEGKRLAVGAPGSGTRKVVLELLAANGVDGSTAQLLDLGSNEAADAIRKGEVDAAFFFASAQAPVIEDLLRLKEVRIVSFRRAEAYPLHFPLVSVVQLPAGGIDLAHDLPPRDTKLLADVAQLVAREDLHPALIGPLLEVARTVHGGPGIFERAGEFPQPREGDIPLSDDAARYYRSGLPFLYRHLPFWAASQATRVALLLIPVLGLALPVLKFVPPLYRWRMRSRIYRWYGDLMGLEADLSADPDPGRRSEYLERLSWIDRQLDNVHPPLSIAEERYAFRLYVDNIRKRILMIGQKESAGTEPPGS